MNESADPCEDFSNFVCGKFYKNKIIPEELGSFSTFTFIIMLENYFLLCCNEIVSHIEDKLSANTNFIPSFLG